MAIVVEVPGMGPTEFPDEAAAEAYFKSNQGTSQTAPRESKLKQAISFLTGIGESMPMTKMAQGASKLILPDEYKPSYQEAVEQYPTTRDIGEVVGTIPQYMAGAAGAKAIPGLASSKLLPTMLRGGLANVAVQQGQRSEIDPEKSVIDALLGMSGELAGAGIQGIGKGVKGLGNKFMNSAIGTTKKQIKQGKNLAEELIKRKVFGTAKGLQQKAGSKLSELEKSLQAILKDKPFPARASSAIDEVTELLAKPEYQAAGEGSARKGIQGVLDDFVAKFKTGGEFAQRPMSLSDANIEKRGLYKAAKKAYDVVGSEMAPSRKEAQKALARGLRKSIEEAEPAVKPLNKELGLYGQLDNLMDDKIAKGALNNLMKFGMSDIAYGGAPAMMGDRKSVV